MDPTPSSSKEEAAATPVSVHSQKYWIRGRMETALVKCGPWAIPIDPACIVRIDVGGDPDFSALINRAKGAK